MTQLELLGLAGAGGGIDISVRGFKQIDLLGIAGAGKSKGAKLILRDAGLLSSLDRLGIAGANPGNVTFVF
ncbi:hypothetical protein MRBLMC3_000813 [Sphingobium sp. LMC3-1-1.1]|uniref:hypothetical protein n=1 Tax=Sphingobium sp. LMC3-1-1.1 TaxID=3135241 RepID=UPI003446F856